MKMNVKSLKLKSYGVSGFLLFHISLWTRTNSNVDRVASDDVADAAFQSEDDLQRFPVDAANV
jgi:hypothetical protein